jgi:hypothetical protein
MSKKPPNSVLPFFPYMNFDLYPPSPLQFTSRGFGKKTSRPKAKGQDPKKP